MPVSRDFQDTRSPATCQSRKFTASTNLRRISPCRHPLGATLPPLSLRRRAPPNDRSCQPRQSGPHPMRTDAVPLLRHHQRPTVGEVSSGMSSPVCPSGSSDTRTPVLIPVAPAPVALTWGALVLPPPNGSPQGCFRPPWPQLAVLLRPNENPLVRGRGPVARRI